MWLPHQIVCPQCGNKFLPAHPSQKYHNDACRMAAYRARKGAKTGQRGRPKKSVTHENSQKPEDQPASFRGSVVEIPAPLVGQGSEQSTVVKLRLPPMFLHNPDAMPAMFLSR